MILSSPVTSPIPRLLLGGLLIHIGLAMLHEWLLQAWCI